MNSELQLAGYENRIVCVFGDVLAKQEVISVFVKVCFIASLLYKSAVNKLFMNVTIGAGFVSIVSISATFCFAFLNELNK